MAYDSANNYYNTVDSTHRYLPPEHQKCGNCLELRSMKPATVGICGVVRGLGIRYANEPCIVQNLDGTPAFVPLRELTEGWVYPPRKRIPYSPKTEL